MADRELSQAEVWDDSALVDSWNEAFEEYKKYHSLAAKGEKVKLNVDESGAKSLVNGDPEATVKPDPTSQGPVTGEGETKDQVSADAQLRVASTTAPIASAVPQAMLSTSPNEDMKNLMMSWYYAGYYTGLYEGKQQGYASAMQRPEG